jgi:hypothetical protein
VLGLLLACDHRPTEAELYACSTEPNGDAEGGPYVDVQVGHFGACALYADGRADCFGCANDDQPDVAFASLDLEYDHACGVSTDGEAVCWGWGPDAPGADYVDVPAGSWVAVAVGERHTCWVGADGSLLCTGDNDEGQLDAPTGTWVQVAAGNLHSCAIDADGCAACWGYDDEGSALYPTERPYWKCGDGAGYAQIEGGEGTTCFRSTQGEVWCSLYWDDDGSGDEWMSRPWEPEGEYIDVGSGSGCTWALSTAGTLSEYGSDCRCAEGLVGASGVAIDVAPGGGCIVDGATMCAATTPGGGCIVGEDGGTACGGNTRPEAVVVRDEMDTGQTYTRTCHQGSVAEAFGG